MFENLECNENKDYTLISITLVVKTVLSRVDAGSLVELSLVEYLWNFLLCGGEEGVSVHVVGGGREVLVRELFSQQQKFTSSSRV